MLVPDTVLVAPPLGLLSMVVVPVDAGRLVDDAPDVAPGLLSKVVLPVPVGVELVVISDTARRSMAGARAFTVCRGQLTTSRNGGAKQSHLAQREEQHPTQG